MSTGHILRGFVPGLKQIPLNTLQKVFCETLHETLYKTLHKMLHETSHEASGTLNRLEGESDMALQNVTGAKCTLCGKVIPAGPKITTCPHCGGILDIEYDYDYIRRSIAGSPLTDRDDLTMWRYREFLPVEGTMKFPRLRVGGSPLYKADALGAQLGIRDLWIKDDGQNPTASLKDRASAMAVTKVDRKCRQLPGRKCGGSRPFHLYFRPLPGAQGQGRPANDVRSDGDPGGRQL